MASLCLPSRYVPHCPTCDFGETHKGGPITLQSILEIAHQRGLKGGRGGDTREAAARELRIAQAELSSMPQPGACPLCHPSHPGRGMVSWLLCPSFSSFPHSGNHS